MELLNDLHAMIEKLEGNLERAEEKGADAITLSFKELVEITCLLHVAYVTLSNNPTPDHSILD
jgi:hypothetical protein